VRDYVILYHELVYQVFANIIYGLSTGESAIIKTFGKDLFDLARSDPEFAAVFHKGLASRARFDASALLEAYDFSGAKKVADIGGGSGSLLSAILARYEQLSGIR
jgi:tRNA A58 N-methylase Trm61